MLDNEPNDSTTDPTSPASSSAPAAPRRRRAASRPAGPPAPLSETPVEPSGSTSRSASADAVPAPADASEAAPDRPARARRTRKTAASAPTEAATPDEPAAAQPADSEAPAPRRRSRKAAAPAAFSAPADDEVAADAPTGRAAAALLFQAPDVAVVSADPADPADPVDPAADEDDEAVAEAHDAGEDEDSDEDHDSTDDTTTGPDGVRRKRRRRGGRGRRRRPADGEGESGAAGELGGADGAADETHGSSTASGDGPSTAAAADDDSDDAEQSGTATRRKRRRRRGGSGDGDAGDEPEGTVVHVREPRTRTPRGGGGDEVVAVRGSTRLEAKKQRRREGRDAGRRRPPILTEAEFLSRRESVDRVMVIRQRGDLTQIAVLEDDVLVEHYVASASQSTMVGNVYLGKVQNVLPSMEAAFIDVGRGRNAVLYAGEVNWDAAGLDGQPRRIEHVLKSGDSVLTQVTKDPIGAKGSRLTSNISLAGRFLVYVPDGSMSGISRKLPENERARLKAILKNVVPEEAGVIVRTAAEGATEEQLTRDVQRLRAQWEDIAKKAKSASAPSLLYGEPDLTVRVVRDLFNEDFDRLVVSGDEAWDVVEAYVGHVAPDLMDRVSKHVGPEDAFAAYRIDEQIIKGLDRKVYLPSGGSLVIDRTEAMTVVDVNTGKFVGKGSGNLEETVTRNNLEAAEEIVRQLRLRDIGGIIVIDFIDMVLESNRDLVLRRLTECLGRDRTKHQVAEVTSLGLVQMTRKRIGQGLLEAFSEPCEVCNGRGIKVHLEPVVHAAEHAHPQRSDKGERVARVARATKAAKSAAVEPAESTADGTESAAADKPVKAVKAARTRQPRAPKAAAAPVEAGGAPADAPAEVPAGEPAAKPPARRRRVAKKAQGSPVPSS